MRKIFLLSVVATVGFAAPLLAAPAALICQGTDHSKANGLDCVREDVLILNSAAKVMVTDAMGAQVEKPLLSCTMDAKPVCTLDYAAAVERVLALLKEKGVNVPDTQWDQIVLFGAGLLPGDIAPMFYRQGYNSAAMSPGVSDVGGIGIEKGPRVAGRPFVGYIAAGDTTKFKLPAKDIYANCANTSLGICSPGIYTYFDALAQATGAMFGPYLPSPDPDKKWELSVLPAAKTKLVKFDATKPIGGDVVPEHAILQPRVWNSFLNMGGSLFGGNNFRNNGNGTFETTKPLPYFGVNPPFPDTLVTATGAQILRFRPLDLYLLGLISESDPDVRAAIGSFATVGPTTLVRPAVSKFDAATGPQMGYKTAVSIRSTPASVVVPAAGRVPTFADAPHTFKQLWVVVVDPAVLPKAGAGSVEDTIKWRKQWNLYFYMLTGYRGRMITTFEGNVDDSAYWEFGQPDDDKQSFTSQGMEVSFGGNERVPNSQEITNIARINSEGDAGILVFRPSKNVPGFAISADQKAQFPVNSVTVRMRVVETDQPPPKDAFAEMTLHGGSTGDLTVRLPDHPSAFLIPDGKWRNYSATLAGKDGFDGTFTGFTFMPSSKAIAGLEIDFIKIGNVANPKDTDMACDTRTAKPDGWIDSEDNCPTLYNPLQTDGNADGKGDACEDFDGDGDLNDCDNCPTNTNSQQRDKNKNGVGDVCDGEPIDSCFLFPETLGGRIRPTPSALLAVFCMAVLGIALIRSRRRR